jgi:hypothetical protein
VTVRTWSSSLGVIAIVATAAACSSDGPAVDGVGGDAAFALATCDALRDFDNGVVDIVNDSVAGISALPADQRPQQLVAGIAATTEAVDAWEAQIDSIELPDLAEADDLRRQLRQGAAEARAELEDRAAEWANPPSAIPDDEVQGEVGIWFNTIEKVMSVSEPEIFTFERAEFKQAFLDEPHCRNVIQQFVND